SLPGRRLQPERLYGRGRVDPTVTQIVVPAVAPQVPRRALQQPPQLSRAEPVGGKPLPQCGRHARGYGARRRGAGVGLVDSRSRELTQPGDVRFAGIEAPGPCDGYPRRRSVTGTPAT